MIVIPVQSAHLRQWYGTIECYFVYYMFSDLNVSLIVVLIIVDCIDRVLMR